MSKFILGIDNYGDLFQDIIPWTYSLSQEELVIKLFEDLNGLRQICLDLAQNRPVDYMKMSNMVGCIVDAADRELSPDSIMALKNATTTILQHLLRKISRHSNWVNCLYRVDKIQFGRMAGYGTLSIVVTEIPRAGAPMGIDAEDLMNRLSKRVLESYVAWDNG